MQPEQPSLLTTFPSSHCSLGCLLPFPQEEVHVDGVPVQIYPCSHRPVEEQPSPLFVLLSSQSSKETTIIPSPYLGWQTSLAEEDPPEQVQVDRTDMQSEAHPKPSNRLPSSHISGVFLIELPQISHLLMTPSTIQFDSGGEGEIDQETHPSVGMILPSSHSSDAALIPSPQVVLHV